MVISLFYHKQGFHVACAETPPRERDLASDLGIAKMHHRQKFGFTISDWFRPRYEPNVCLLLKHRETQSHGYFFSFLEWLVAQVRPQIILVAPLRN